MSFGSRLIHTLTVERATGGMDDEYNQPSETFSAIATINALPQPKTISEMALTTQAGVVVGNWTVFAQPGDVRESDRLLHDAVTCPVPSVNDLPSGFFQPTGVRNAAGVGHHLEIDARLVDATPAGS